MTAVDVGLDGLRQVAQASVYIVSFVCTQFTSSTSALVELSAGNRHDRRFRLNPPTTNHFFSTFPDTYM